MVQSRGGGGAREQSRVWQATQLGERGRVHVYALAKLALEQLVEATQDVARRAHEAHAVRCRGHIGFLGAGRVEVGGGPIRGAGALRAAREPLTALTQDELRALLSSRQSRNALVAEGGVHIEAGNSFQLAKVQK